MCPRLGDATWPEIEACAAAGPTTLLVPLGATEQHGPHLPLGTDSMIAAALTEAAAARTTGAVVAPLLPYGSSGEHQDFPGTLSIGAAATELVLIELARSATETFDRVLFVNAHGGNAGPLAVAVARLRDESRDVRLWSPRFGGDAHAGRTETSLLLTLDPDPAPPERGRPDQPPPPRGRLNPPPPERGRLNPPISPEGSTAPRAAPGRTTAVRGAPGRTTAPRGAPEGSTAVRGAPEGSTAPRGAPERSTAPRGAPGRTTAVRGERVEVGNTTALAELIDELRARGVRAVSPNGVLGDPAGASAEEGRALFDAAVEDLCATLAAWPTPAVAR